MKINRKILLIRGFSKTSVFGKATLNLTEKPTFPKLTEFWKRLIIIAIIFTLLIPPIIIYLARAPVLLVTEQSFVNLYGRDRLKKDINRVSFSLFRQIKIVEVANDAGDDIVQFAVSDISVKPFCVLFPRRFTRSAYLYGAQNPDIRIIILEGRYPGVSSVNSGRENFYFFNTDIESDFYNTGLAAAIFADNMSGNIAVFIEPEQYLIYGSIAREAFLKGVNDQGGKPETYFYTGFSDLPETAKISCAVIAGAGLEFLDKKQGIPVILFTWLDPSLVPDDVVLIVDDSPAAQVKKAAAFSSGSIQSKFYIVNRSKIEGKVLQKIKKIGKNTEISP